MIQNSLNSALRRGLFFTLAAAMAALASTQAAEESFGGTKSSGAKVAEASKDAELAMKKFQLAPGLQMELWAAEPLVANIVSFNFDDQGHCYVVETFRHSQGVTDIRGHMDWLDEELASKSVEERVAIMKRHEGARIKDYGVQTDRVRKVWDSAGLGHADKATVFSEGYNDIADGLAAGVLAWRGSVYFTDIPHLWKLQDLDGDGVAEQKQSLLNGFGVRVGFLGHDLHGLIVGPDGRLYFTIGDRGAHVVTADGRTVSNPETGAFYRCNLDGTGFEIVASGLRNPQEIAFDDLGNWFTGDNNSDGGDPARWVYLVEGGDSGWRIGYQFIDSPNSRGPWIAEKMCLPQTDGQPAYIIPPVANIANGPSGLAHYPGTGLSEKYRGRFFLCDFTGGKGSTVHSFGLKPRGAGFEMIERERLISDLLCTDVEVGPDGGVYVSDWVQGWDKTGKGRIYRVFDPTKVQDPLRLETRDLIAADLSKRRANDLGNLLAHPDQRVRLRAQFALVEQSSSGEKTLRQSARSHTNLLARIHGIWGLGQLFRATQSVAKKKEIASFFLQLLKDSDTEIRAQAAKALGEAEWRPAAESLTRLISDPQPRTRFLAAMALGKLKQPGSAATFLSVARSNDDQKDPYLRHAAVMGLVGAADESALVTAQKDPVTEVRRVALLALRRMSSPQAALFLNDPDPDLVIEAARAINDLPIPAALPALAVLDISQSRSTPLGRRVVNANFRLGARENADALVKIATDSKTPTAIRTEALQSLAQWARPSGRDHVTGLWRPLAVRPVELASGAVTGQLASWLKASESSVQREAAKLAALWGRQDLGGSLFALVGDAQSGSPARREALNALATLKDSHLAEAVEIAGRDADETLRKEAIRLQGVGGGSQAVRQLQDRLEKGSRGEQQAALGALASQKDPSVNSVLNGWLDRLIAGTVPAEIQLDLLETAAKRADTGILAKLTQFEKTRKGDDSIGQYRECLQGGDAEAGKKIFLERADVACVRCHKVRGEGGEVGPELTGIISRNPREYILESIVAPNRKIAAGFETVLLTLKDGTAYAGQVKRENDTEIEINSPEEGMLKLSKANIATREQGQSGMPEELRQMLTKQDLRNLIEFLATLK